MKKLSILFVLAILIGCAATRVQTPGKPVIAVTPLEQAHSYNAQVAIHNRAVAKAIIATQQAGFIEPAYFDTLTREQIEITRAHKDLTPLIKDLATAKSNSEKIKSVVNRITKSAGALAAGAGVKNPNSKQLITSEALAVSSAANSILLALQSAGVF